MGLKGQPTYRIVVTDKRKARNGMYLEAIGHHNPRTRPTTDIVDEERALYWLSVGAQPSEAVVSILNRTGTMKRFERLRNGEDMEALVAEAEAAREEAEDVSPRTQYPAPTAGHGKKAQAAEAIAEEAVAEAEAEE
jgi:small subunit ribosomal protein S16